LDQVGERSDDAKDDERDADGFQAIADGRVVRAGLTATERQAEQRDACGNGNSFHGASFQAVKRERPAVLAESGPFRVRVGFGRLQDGLSVAEQPSDVTADELFQGRLSLEEGLGADAAARLIDLIGRPLSVAERDLLWLVPFWLWLVWE
jgi:hypothetical protein